MEGVVRWLVGYMISALETVSSFCEFTISGSFEGALSFTVNMVTKLEDLLKIILFMSPHFILLQHR